MAGGMRKRPARERPSVPRAEAKPRTIDPLHLDHIAGGVTKLALRLANPVANTLGDVGTYLGRTTGELFPSPTAVPDVVRTARWQLPGLISEDLVFRSPYEPLEPNFRRRYAGDYGASHTVYARHLRPAAACRRPRLLYLHGYMQPETIVEELTLLTTLALTWNVEVIQMQVPHHGRRASSGSRFSGERFWTADLVRSVEALRQTMVDARALLRWLKAEDARPVGVAGLSLGGALTLSLACLEEGFDFAVPLIAHMDLAALVRDAPVLSKMRHDLRGFGWGRVEFDRFVEQLGWQSLEPKLPPERVLMVAAASDRFFEPEIVERMWERWGYPEIRWYPTSHMGFLPFLPDAIRNVRRFIDALV